MYYLHPGSGDHTPHVRHHRLREDFVDESVVPHEPGVCHMFHTTRIHTFENIFKKLTYLDLNAII